jgi:catechol 2,3-dioxygenase-like lactoylglutathione lyase family enzyme
MSVLGAHHVSFSVADIEKTVHFYRDVLGLTLRSRSENEYDGLGTARSAPSGASITRTRTFR